MTTKMGAAGGLTQEQLENAVGWLAEARESPDRTTAMADWADTFGERLIAALRAERRRAAALAEAAKAVHDGLTSARVGPNGEERATFVMPKGTISAFWQALAAFEEAGR